MCRGQKTGHLSNPKPFNVKLGLTRHTDHKNGTIYLDDWLVTLSDETRLIRRQWAIQPVPTHLYRFLQHQPTCMGYRMDNSRR